MPLLRLLVLFDVASQVFVATDDAAGAAASADCNWVRVHAAPITVGSVPKCPSLETNSRSGGAESSIDDGMGAEGAKGKEEAPPTASTGAEVEPEGAIVAAEPPPLLSIAVAVVTDALPLPMKPWWEFKRRPPPAVVA